MKLNEGKLDRTVRILAGAFIVSLAFWGPKTDFGFLGFIPLMTGIIGICPLYSILGLNTCAAPAK